MMCKITLSAGSDIELYANVRNRIRQPAIAATATGYLQAVYGSAEQNELPIGLEKAIASLQLRGIGPPEKCSTSSKAQAIFQ